MGENRYTTAAKPPLQAEMLPLLEHISCGIAVYRQEGDQFCAVFRNPAFYQTLGYSETHIHQIREGHSLVGVHPEDLSGLRIKTAALVREGGELNCTFRVFHDGKAAYCWIQMKGTRYVLDSGVMLLYAAYTDVTMEKQVGTEPTDANEKIQDIVNALPGGVASCRVENGRFVPHFYSDGVAVLWGCSREEFDALLQGDILNLVYDGDQARVAKAVQEAVNTGEILNLSYRTRHRDGSLVWVHLNGRRIGPLIESSTFYASFSGISSESKMYREIANETADAIYVIDRANYEVLYFHDAKKLFPDVENCIGKRCYEVLQGQSAPCSFCSFSKDSMGGDTEMVSQWNGRTYRLHVQETDWNGIPAFIQYLRDITEEVETRQEKQRLEQYFQTLVESLPGGVAVVRDRPDGRFVPEFISAGFAEMLGNTSEEAWQIYGQDAMAGIHPEDAPKIRQRLDEAFARRELHCELTYRLQTAAGGYLWVKNTLSMLPSEEGVSRQYMFLRDITQERQAEDHIREQYKKQILQHYRMPGPNVLLLGHCNVTRDRILEISDYTGGGIKAFGTRREAFFTAFSNLIVGTEMQQKFLEIYLNKPMLEAYRRKETERVLLCRIQLPEEETGRYVQCKVNLVEEPDTGDVTGILTVTDITEQTVADQVLKRLSDTGYDHILVLDLFSDHYMVFTQDPKASCVPPQSGDHTEWMHYLLESRILPRDRETYRKHLDTDYIVDTLQKNSAYSFDYMLTDDEGNIRVKRMTVFAIDLWLGRVGLSRTDVTETVREQQGLLNMLAYTFELAGFIDIDTGRLLMHTRQTVLEDLPPYDVEDYDQAIQSGVEPYGGTEQEQEEIRNWLRLETFIKKLEEQPAGYDFVCPYWVETELQYKKINVLWGDRSHRTICLVRADVTEMLAAERKNKQELEEALRLANQANRAKSDFLSAMSHDIRTPMNAIMGMTTLASSRPEDAAYVAGCLRKIALSSKHLLNLINDVLDMSKIEQSRIELGRERIVMQEMIQQISAMILPQAKEKHQQFRTTVVPFSHHSVYGDALRLNQILINILGNAVKFTPVGGEVLFQVEECPAKIEGCARYRFSVQDTGIGMTPAVLSHIFEPFARGPNVNRVEGTGLGLSITKGLVDRMGGVISAESQEGAGSLFRVELEFETGPGGEMPENGQTVPVQTAQESSELFRGRHFLIAEDNGINAEILESLLKMYGATATVKPNGAQTVQAFSDTPPGTYDAILMDIQMPVMNGYEAAATIREMDRADAGTIPVIAMTANAFAEDVQAALNAGMNAHVAKPIDLDVLKTTLCSVFS